ncbi:MAG: SPOR domain-containing protein [Campylobacterota bacterium]|nr:SPOR domain-containing protein [Campylobacterota bacterium]
MEVNGKEFLRNVSIEQDKADLADQQKKLDEQKRESLKKVPDYFESQNSEESAYVNISKEQTTEIQDEENSLFDIKLDNNSNNKNKKKYIILGFALILLFIITIVIIRIISNNDQEKQLETQTKITKTINKDKILDKIDSIEEYQKVIENNQKPVTPKIEKKDIILPEPIKDESPVTFEKKEIKKEIKKDLFELEKKVVEKTETKTEKIKQKVISKPKEIVKPKVAVQTKQKEIIAKTPVKRKIILPPVVETNLTKKSNSKVQGYYIQIGAFSKKPSDKLLNSITKKGYRYDIHSVVVKGKTYNKVLIGSYPSKALALKVIYKVRKDFNNPSAYILKF